MEYKCISCSDFVSFSKRIDVLRKPPFKVSARAMHCLHNANITTIKELAAMSDSDLLRLRNFGPKRLEEVRGKLADLMSRDLINELVQSK
tara:strand:+ start:342 stop:611 length:270 start_codon:yes stop_codon:yes gene_type:complete